MVTWRDGPRSICLTHWLPVKFRHLEEHQQEESQLQSTKNQSVGQLEPRSDHVPGRKGAALASNWLNSTGATFRLIVFILPLARREIEIEGEKKWRERERNKEDRLWLCQWSCPSTGLDGWQTQWRPCWLAFCHEISISHLSGYTQAIATSYQADSCIQSAAIDLKPRLCLPTSLHHSIWSDWTTSSSWLVLLVPLIAPIPS